MDIFKLALKHVPVVAGLVAAVVIYIGAILETKYSVGAHIAMIGGWLGVVAIDVLALRTDIRKLKAKRIAKALNP